jgi:hypothetical protein
VSWALNNIMSPDAYTAASTMTNLPFPSRVNIDVSGAAVYWQLQQATSPSGLNTEGTWQQEVFMTPGSRTLFRSGVRGVRVRSAVAGIPAQVTIEAVE